MSNGSDEEDYIYTVTVDGIGTEQVGGGGGRRWGNYVYTVTVDGRWEGGGDTAAVSRWQREVEDCTFARLRAARWERDVTHLNPTLQDQCRKIAEGMKPLVAQRLLQFVKEINEL